MFVHLFQVHERLLILFLKPCDVIAFIFPQSINTPKPKKGKQAALGKMRYRKNVIQHDEKERQHSETWDKTASQKFSRWMLRLNELLLSNRLPDAPHPAMSQVMSVELRTCLPVKKLHSKCKVLVKLHATITGSGGWLNPCFVFQEKPNQGDSFGEPIWTRQTGRQQLRPRWR